MDRKKPVLILSLTVAIALAVSCVTYYWLRDKAFAMQNLETEQVAVAVRDLPWGTVLTAEMAKSVPYLKKSLVKGTFAEPARLSGRTLVYPVKAGEPLLESKLAPPAVSGGGVAAVIAPNRRAMAVKVDKVIGVAGFIHPGNRVDVLVTLQQTARLDSPVAKTVLENVLVLAVGPEVDPSAKQDRPQPVDVITLEVTPQQGEKLALASAQGKLQLALRNFCDGGEVVTRGTTIPMLLGRPADPEVRPARLEPRERPAPAPPSELSVEIVRGSKVCEIKVQKEPL